MIFTCIGFNFIKLQRKTESHTTRVSKMSMSLPGFCNPLILYHLLLSFFAFEIRDEIMPKFTIIAFMQREWIKYANYTSEPLLSALQHTSLPKH